MAGLDRVALSCGDIETATAHVEEIIDHIATGNLDGTGDPIEIYLTCCRVLQEAGDPRARAILDKAYRFLLELADKTNGPALQRAFRSKAVHQEISGLMAASRV